MTSPRSVDPVGEYRRALSVLDGKRVSENKAAVYKMLNLISSREGTDVVISPAGFSVLYPYWSKPFSYFADLGPPTLQALLRGGGVSDAARGAVFRVERLPDGPRWVWLTVDGDAIHLAVRPATDEGPPPATYTGLPPPLPGPRRLDAELPEASKCPHCAAQATSWRYQPPAFICSACGRSFEPGAELIGTAHIEDAGD